ncbi:hypothetical protein JCM37173_31890 [Allocoprococcus similis]
MSEILAFSESADSDPKLSTEPVSESGDIHTATDVPPQEAPAPEPDSPETTSKDGSEEITHESASEAETMSSEEKKNTYTDFSSGDFKYSDDSEKDPFTGEKKSSHHRIFHTAKELNYLREKYILEKIPDDQLLEYLKLEEKRHELQVQERNIREKRIMNAFMLTVILAAIVAVVYSLHENPTVLISILYIGGILAGIHVWNKKK